MRAIANSPSFAKKVGVSQSVGREFTKKGTDMKKMNMGGMYAKGGMKKGGSYRKAADGPVVKKGKTKGMQVKMAAGGKMTKGCK